MAKKANTTCGVLILTHGKQGEALLESVAHMLGAAVENAVAVSLFGVERRGEIERRCAEAVQSLQREVGEVLILSDLFGSTQAHMAGNLSSGSAKLLCVHGVNLAMVLEAVTMRHLPLAQLQKRVVEIGRKAIIPNGSDD